MTPRLIVTNGCSHTRGAELEHPEREAWPHVLAAGMGVPLVNLACDGGSNRRIVRTTVGHLADAVRARGVAPEETLFLCQWTALTRAEHFVERRTDPPNRPDLPYEANWHRLGHWRVPEKHAASVSYFRDLWSDEGATVDFFTDWLTLDAYLWRGGFPRGYIYGWDILPADIPAQARPLMARLDPGLVFGGSLDSSHRSFRACTEDDFEFTAYYHPKAPAHAHLAKLCAEWLAGGALLDAAPGGVRPR
ncbi:DUF6071 family protein [Longispora urticae]